MDYEYMPKPDNKRVKGICTALFVGSVVLFFASGFEAMQLPWLMQFIAICMLTVSISLMGRYLLRYYLYRIERNGERYDFTVDEITKRGRVTVCRLGLSQLYDVKPWNGDTKPKGSAKVYNYCAEARPKESWLLIFEDGGVDVYIRIAPDETMKNLLQNAAVNREESAQ